MTSASIATAKINIINTHIANIVIIHIANIVISLINRKKNQRFERLKFETFICQVLLQFSFRYPRRYGHTQHYDLVAGQALGKISPELLTIFHYFGAFSQLRCNIAQCLFHICYLSIYHYLLPRLEFAGAVLFRPSIIKIGYLSSISHQFIKHQPSMTTYAASIRRISLGTYRAASGRPS